MSGQVSIPDAIAADMRGLPEATRKAVRPRLRAAGRLVVTEAKAGAGWSTRIPGTVRMSTSFRQDREGVTITAGNKATPHARPFEDVAQRGRFRHPVHADSKNRTRRGWIWVTQVSRPFLFPAATKTGAAASTEIRAALDDAARQVGFFS